MRIYMPKCQGETQKTLSAVKSSKKCFRGKQFTLEIEISPPRSTAKELNSVNDNFIVSQATS